MVSTATLLLVAYALLDLDAPAIVELFGGTAPLIAVLIWLHGYARRRRMAWLRLTMLRAGPVLAAGIIRMMRAR